MTSEVEVWPGHPNPTHHLALEGRDGRILGLIMCDSSGAPLSTAVARNNLQSLSLKVSEGNPKYSDFDFPFTPISQDDWQGGRGQEAIERDLTKYLDSGFVDTTRPNKAFLAGLPLISHGHRSCQFNMAPWSPQAGGSVKWQALLPSGSRRYLAVKFAAWYTATAKTVSILVKKVGTPTASLTVKTRSDSTGNPGTVLDTLTLTVASVTDITGEWQHLTIDRALTAATNYWIEVYGGSSDDVENHWEVGVDPSPTAGTTKESADDSTWTASGINLYFQWRDAGSTLGAGTLFRYKGAQYFLKQPAAGGAASLWLNGDRGDADANGSNLLRVYDSTKSWTTDMWKGCVVLIIAGPGSDEEQPWRNISSNGSTELVVDTAWKITHTTSTQYVILGSYLWTQVTCTLAAPVTDFAIFNGIIYFAMGSGQNIRRYIEYDNAGTWTRADADDSTNKADLLAVVIDKTDGPRLWRCLTEQISNAAKQTWGTNLTFGTAIDAGDPYDKARRLLQYVDPDTAAKVLWVIKEGSLGVAQPTTSPKYDEVMLPEMKAVTSRNNGRAAITHNVYLYFSLLYSLERFYQSTLDDVGPIAGRGLPSGRAGPIRALAGYPGKLFAAVLATYSSILAHTGGGNYHEFYRSWPAARNIYSLDVQVIPGLPDRLWFQEGDDIGFLPMPSETTDPTQDTTFPYRWEGHLISSRIHAGMQDLVKLWDTIKALADNLSDEQWLEFDYKVDNESNDWQTLPGRITSSETPELPFGDREDVKGKWLMYRLRLNTQNCLKTPVVRGVVAFGVTRIPIRHSFAPTVVIADDVPDLRNQPDQPNVATALEKLALLEDWGSGINVLRLHSIHSAFHGARVFIEHPNISPVSEDARPGHERYVGTIAITELAAIEPAGQELQRMVLA